MLRQLQFASQRAAQQFSGVFFTRIFLIGQCRGFNWIHPDAGVSPICGMNIKGRFLRNAGFITLFMGIQPAAPHPSCRRTPTCQMHLVI